MSADNYTKCPKCQRQDKNGPSLLREDYEIYMSEDGHLLIHYKASCAACEFVFTFSDRVKALQEK